MGQTLDESVLGTLCRASSMADREIEQSRFCVTYLWPERALISLRPHVFRVNNIWQDDVVQGEKELVAVAFKPGCALESPAGRTCNNTNF